MEKLREFYSFYIKKRVEERNELIQLAPFYESEDSVRKTLSKGPISINMERWEKIEKSLMIVDSLKKYSDNDSPESDINFNKNLVKYAKTNGKAGVSILTDTGAFSLSTSYTGSYKLRIGLPSNYDIDLKRVCLFHKKDFNKLSKDQKQKLVNHHPIALKYETFFDEILSKKYVDFITRDRT